MREIKFRVWDKKRKILIYQDSHKDLWEMPHRCNLSNIFIDSVTVYYEEEDASDRGTYHLSEGQYELSQYTGLKDKNGVEVFEGDILKFKARDMWETEMKEYMKEIHWNEEELCWWVGDSSRGFKPNMTTDDLNFEVVSNIYQIEKVKD